MQTRRIFRSTSAQVTYGILLVCIIINFVLNLSRNITTQYISQMFDPVKTLTLSSWSNVGLILMIAYPILAVLPTSSSWMNDEKSGIVILEENRVGKHKYWISKLASVFIATFFIFTVPFLIELLLNRICFPVSSLGDPSGFSFIDKAEEPNRYIFSALWWKNRYLWAVVWIMLFGAVSGILAVFNFSLTTLQIFKYRVLTLIPIYILLYLISTAELLIQPTFSMSYLLILRMFSEKMMNYQAYGIFCLALLLVSVLAVFFRAKRDQLS